MSESQIGAPETAAAGGATTAGTSRFAAAETDTATGTVEPRTTWPTAITTDPERAAGRTGWIFGVISILWLAGKLWAAYRGIGDSGGGSLAVAAAANVLPAIMQASLLAGVGAGVVASTALRRRAAGSSTSVRWIVTVAAGLIVGLAGTGAILIGYGRVPSVSGVAVSVAIAGAAGAAIVAIRREPGAVTAGLAGAVASVLVATALNSDRVVARMMSALGGPPTAPTAKIVSANAVLSHVDAGIVGVVAGVVAYLVLRRMSPRGGIPAYLTAGALTGLLLLGAEVFIRIGGADVLRATRAISEADDLSLADLASARVIGALLVLFAGAFAALIGYGRSLPARTPQAVPPAVTPAPPAPPAPTPAQRKN